MEEVLAPIVALVSTIGWLLVWLLAMVAAVWQILRGRSGAGACLGMAAILGLGLQICGPTVHGTVAGLLSVAPPWAANGVAGFVVGLGQALILGLLIAGAVLQRPVPGAAPE